MTITAEFQGCKLTLQTDINWHSKLSDKYTQSEITTIVYAALDTILIQAENK